MKLRKKITILAGCIIMSILATGCGKEESNSLKRVLKEEKLTVVGSGGYPPFNYMEDGKVTGFDVEVGAEIAKRMDVELNYVTSDWDGLIEGLRNKRYDGILGSMAITEERVEVVNFTVPYYYSGAQLFTLDDSKIEDVNEMEGKTIAVAIGTNFVEDAEALGAEAATYQDDNATMLELVSGRIDGVITDRLVGISAMEEIAGGEHITMTGDLLRLESMGIAINKEDTELVEEINVILEEMHKDGTMRTISEKWLNGVDVTVK